MTETKEDLFNLIYFIQFRNFSKVSELKFRAYCPILCTAFSHWLIILYTTSFHLERQQSDATERRSVISLFMGNSL